MSSEYHFVIFGQIWQSCRKFKFATKNNNHYDSVKIETINDIKHQIPINIAVSFSKFIT